MVDLLYLNDFDFNVLLVKKHVGKGLFEQTVSSSDSSTKPTNSANN